MVHRDRLLADQEALARVRMRLEHVRRAQMDTQARLLDIQRAAAALANEAHELRSAEQTLVSTLERTQAAILQEYTARLPDDIWRCIFEEAVLAEYERSVAFILAGVCIRWRRIALSSPTLWNNINPPVPPVTKPATQAILARQYDAFKLMLSRSGACPLDIRILWYHTREAATDDVVAIMRDILAVLADQAYRWRFFFVLVPGNIGRQMLAVLKGPTPALEFLHLSIAHNSALWAHDVDPGYLPCAPRLRSLTLSGACMAPSESAIAKFPSIKEVRIASHQRLTSSRHVLSFYDPAREFLHKIEIPAWLSGPAGTRTPLLLPQLEILYVSRVYLRGQETLSAIPSLTLLSTPRLNHLTLDRKCILAAPLSFLSAVCQTVRTLKVLEELTPDLLEHLAHLRNIERLEFGIDPPGPLLDAAVCDTLSTRVPPIWPKLAAIDMQYADEVGGDSLLRFIAARNVAGADGDADAEGGTDAETAMRPCRLREVILGPDVPRWVRDEVQRLLSL